MSIQKGNEFWRKGELDKAIEEYKKIPKDSPLYKLAQQNIHFIMNKKIPKIMNISLEKDTTKNEQPLVSVVMPVYNVEKYLDASILSVRGQSYENLEIIIVNDASTDNGIDIIRMHEKLDTRIKVIDLEFNTLGGAGIPSNIGVEHAKGKYIAYADSDDILDKYAIEKMVALAEKEDLEVVIADFCNFSEEGREVKVAYDKEKWKGFPLEKAFSPVEKPEIFRLSPVPWRKLYKRDFLIKHDIKFPEGDYFFEDNPLHWFVLAMAKRVALLDYVVAYHRMGREGQTMGSDSYKLSVHYIHLMSVMNFFISKKNIPSIYWKELLFRAKMKWIVNSIDDEHIKKILIKRQAQTIKRINYEAKKIYKDIIFINSSDNKIIEEYDNILKDVDLTIIIPIYNCADLLDKTLYKLTKFKNITVEVLLMDDGSLDNSKDICNKYVKNYDNFYFFSQKNKGAGSARNALIPLATGKYTYFLDSDDTIDINELEEAVRLAKHDSYDLLLFKYKIHFYENDTYNEMFNSDKKLWDSLVNATTNNDKQIIALGLINYPWIRIIKTELLHNENIFFGKTIVHNDIPYHWHSILAAKNIGLYEKPVCIHRKFNNREQITNINDNRRMMIFEAYRHTNNIIKKYTNSNKILHVWKEFVEKLLIWAENRIPNELKIDYNNKMKKVLYELEIQIDMLKKKKFIGFYRIIGNNIGKLHSSEQSLNNLIHIIKNETNFNNVDKIFILNRIVDRNIEDELINYLKESNLKYIRIEFNLDEYKKIGYDLRALPDSYFWFAKKKDDWHRKVAKSAVRNYKNSYLINNNGARNFALSHGKKQYIWTMPWDGNCFLSDPQYKVLENTFKKIIMDKSDYKYVMTPMERVLDNSLINSKSISKNAIDEPQISFRYDSNEIFNPERVYAYQPKVELFKRLSYNGSWDNLNNLYPWKKLEFNKSDEAGKYIVASSVFRLASGNKKAAVCGKTRSHERLEGVIEFIDKVESLYVSYNYKNKKNFINKINNIINNFIDKKIIQKIIKEKIKYNIKNSQDSIYFALIMFTNNSMDKDIIKHCLHVSKHFNEGVELFNKHKYKATLNNTLVLLLINLTQGNFIKSIQLKLDLVMLLYFYYTNKETLEITNDKHFNMIKDVVMIFFEDIFEYNLFSDLKKVGIKE